MISVASRVSSEFNFLRVDLYSNGKEVKIGELTNCPDAAIGNFIPGSGEDVAKNLLFGAEGFHAPYINSTR